MYSYIVMPVAHRMLQFLGEEVRTKGEGHWRSSAVEALEPDLEPQKGQPREAMRPNLRGEKDSLCLAFITEHKNKLQGPILPLTHCYCTLVSAYH